MWKILAALALSSATAHALDPGVKIIIADWEYGDTAGIPVGGPYLGTCMLTCDAIPEYAVNCRASQRPNFYEPSCTGDGLQQRCLAGWQDCATQCRHLSTTPDMPLRPDQGVPGSNDWRVAGTGWCRRFVRRTDTGEAFYPACHAENYQFTMVHGHGPGDSECWYPGLPSGVPWEYVDMADETAVTTLVPVGTMPALDAARKPAAYVIPQDSIGEPAPPPKKHKGGMRKVLEALRLG